MIENIDNEKVIVMKRIKWLAPIVCAAILAAPGTASAESTDVELIVDHAHVSGSAAEGEVYINDAGRTMIPLRIVSSAMGYTTVWQPDGSIRITSPDGTVDVSLAVGKLDYSAGGQSGRFETAPTLRHDRTYLPARDFSELYGSIYWDGDTRTVWIAQGAGVSYQVIGNKLLRADEAGARVLALPDGLRLRSGSLLIDREAGGARYVAVQCDGGHATPASKQYDRMPLRFSSVSLINGRTGVNHTTVGIPFFCIASSTSYRRFVVHTFGSKTRHKSSSYVVSVICTTAFALLLILQSRSASRKIISDFVSTVTPKPCLSMTSRHRLVSLSFSSQCIYGSLIAPVPIIHSLRFEASAFSRSSGAFRFTSTSSKSCRIL